jgi:hypothetical protein
MNDPEQLREAILARLARVIDPETGGASSVGLRALRARAPRPLQRTMPREREMR